MFRPNETVLYGAQGVCQVEGIIQKEVNGHAMDYYVLKPVYNVNSVIYVPVQNTALTDKMRRVLAADEIRAIIRTMPQGDSLWIEDENERKIKYREILTRGDRRELIQLIKALYLHQQDLQKKGKRLHSSDERFLKDAEKMLYDEFALVLHIQPEQVLPFILNQLKEEEGGAAPRQ